MSENMDSEHYKERYLFYKEKCVKLEEELKKHRNILSSFRTLLDTAPKTPEPTRQSSILPIHATPPAGPSSDQNASPILAQGVRASWLRYRAPRLKLFNEENFEPGGNKWEAEDLLEISYDRLPKSPESDKVVRGKKRRSLPGRTCNKCNNYYDMAGLGDHAPHHCSRHRSRHTPVKSPKGFWDVDMPSTQEIRARQTRPTSP